MQSAARGKRNDAITTVKHAFVCECKFGNFIQSAYLGHYQERGCVKFSHFGKTPPPCRHRGSALSPCEGVPARDLSRAVNENR